MDLSGLSDQQLLKISTGEEQERLDIASTSQSLNVEHKHVIEFDPSKTQHIVEIDPNKLVGVETVEIDASKILEVFSVAEAPKESTIEGTISGGQQIVILNSNCPQPEVFDVSDDDQPILRFSSFGDFKRALTEYESQTITKFILRNQSRQFTHPVCLHDILHNEKKSSDLPLIRWEFCASKDFLPIPFMGIPYITVGKQVFQCHQGKDYNTTKKQQYELKKEILNQATRFQIKTRNKGPSKKKDCPVLFAVRKIYLFPEFPLENDSKRNRALIAQKIREKLSHIKNEQCTCQHKETENETNNLPGKIEYLTKLPGTNSHNHDVSRAAKFLESQLKRMGTKGVQMMQTKKLSQANPYQYDKHIELITALRSTGDLNELRIARESMSAVYPLTEELWLQWFQDELPLAVIPTQKEYLFNKFEVAVKDYISTKIWHEYCQFAMNNIDSPTDIDRARNIFEKAITAVGLHVTEGASIWEGYREFEIAILDSYQQLQDSGDSIGMDAKVEAQTERIASIFKRQLSIPLFGMSDTFQVYEDWTPDHISDQTLRAYEKASDKLLSRMEFEEKLHNATGNKLAEYNEYISFEMSIGDPPRIQCIFERAIKENCLEQSLWEKYLNYLDYKLKLPSISVSAHERAVRNCPWVSKFWVGYLKALERNNEEYNKVKEVFDQSLKGGFATAEGYLEVWMANCDYHRRRMTDDNLDENKVERLHKAFEAAVTYMNHYFGLEGDKNCVLLREWAFIEGKYLNNVKRGQELWDTVMKKHSRDTNMWLEYVQYLMLFADDVAVRRVFQRAVQISFDFPEPICEACIAFERRYGTLADVDNAQQKVDIQLQKVGERRSKDTLRESTQPKKHSSSSGKKSRHSTEGDDARKKKKKKLKDKQHLKRNADSADLNQKDNVEPIAKKSKGTREKPKTNTDSFPNTSSDIVQSSGETTSEISTTEVRPSNIAPEHPEETFHQSEHSNDTPVAMETEQSNPVAIEQLDPIESTQSNVTETKTSNSKQIDNRLKELSTEDSSKVDNARSVFLSNLLFTVDEAMIREKFDECGHIETVRIIVNRVGKSKGYAYLEFKEETSVKEALHLDRSNLSGRPVFVSECVDKKQNPTKFKFPTSIDKSTLYVTNIPFEVQEDELRREFEQVGALKQVRLVTNRSGKSKGYAYVEYETEIDAASAILKFDQYVFRGRPINVAISNPPARKNPERQQELEAMTSSSKSQNKSFQDVGRGRAKTQISLVPRSIHSKGSKCDSNNDEKTPVNSTTAVADKKTTVDSTDNATSSKMSNADFRKFLMK